MSFNATYFRRVGRGHVGGPLQKGKDGSQQTVLHRCYNHTYANSIGLYVDHMEPLRMCLMDTSCILKYNKPNINWD